MSRLLLVAAVTCALCVGCGKATDDQANANPSGAGPDRAAVGGAPSPGATSSNPVTNFFGGLDRAAKGAGAQR
jgi:hypothetical protein